MKKIDDDSIATPRSTWKTGRVERIAPGVRHTIGNMIKTKTVKRSQAISIAGRSRERYFAIASDDARKIVEPITIAMPRNGRSECPVSTAGMAVLGGGTWVVTGNADRVLQGSPRSGSRINSARQDDDHGSATTADIRKLSCTRLTAARAKSSCSAT